MRVKDVSPTCLSRQRARHVKALRRQSHRKYEQATESVRPTCRSSLNAAIESFFLAVPNKNIAMFWQPLRAVGMQVAMMGDKPHAAAEAHRSRKGPAANEAERGRAAKQPEEGQEKVSCVSTLVVSSQAQRRKESDKAAGPKTSRCPHKRQKSNCKECRGTNICEHQNQRHQCKECKGKGICQHQRQKSKCKECGGTSICKHQKQRHQCKECKGKGFCIHQRQRSKCKECRGAPRTAGRAQAPHSSLEANTNTQQSVLAPAVPNTSIAVYKTTAHELVARRQKITKVSSHKLSFPSCSLIVIYRDS